MFISLSLKVSHKHMITDTLMKLTSCRPLKQLVSFINLQPTELTVLKASAASDWLNLIFTDRSSPLTPQRDAEETNTWAQVSE